MAWWKRESDPNNIPINLGTIHVENCLFSINFLPEFNITKSTWKIHSTVHCKFHMNNFTKITKYFFKMAFIYIPCELINVKNSWLWDRRCFPCR